MMHHINLLNKEINEISPMENDPLVCIHVACLCRKGIEDKLCQILEELVSAIYIICLKNGPTLYHGIQKLPIENGCMMNNSLLWLLRTGLKYLWH